MRYPLLLALLLLAKSIVAGEPLPAEPARVAPGSPAAWHRDPVPDPDAPPAVVELVIPSADARMAAMLYQANGAGPHPTVVLLHGLPGNEKNLDIAQLLRRAGFNAS